jgi:flagellin
MAIINTNISAVITQNAMAKNDRAMQTTMERLSTGKSVNSAQDDAAGIAVSSRMTSQIRGLDQAVQNAGDAISMIQTADGASIELGNMMQRMRELAVQATNGTVTTTDQGSLDLEFQQLKAEIARVAKNSQWNGDNILDGTAGTSSNGTATYQIGANAQQVMDVSFGDWSLNAPTTNIAAVYDSIITDGTATGIDGMVTLSDGTTTITLDYGTTNTPYTAASPTSTADLISDITSHPLYGHLNFTVAANAGGSGLSFTYKTPDAVATPPTFTALDGGIQMAGNMTVTTEGRSVTGVAAVYRTALSDANVAAIDGNVILSDGENTLTVDASSVSTLDALASAITSHADHADLDFTVSKQPAVSAVAQTFDLAGVGDAAVEAIANAGQNYTISDGTTTITVTGAAVDAIDGAGGDAATRADLIATIQANGSYGAFKFTVSAHPTDTAKIVFTADTAGVSLVVPTVVGNTTPLTITENTAGADAIAAGLTFTYENARQVLSNPTITADDGGFDIANAVTEVTAGFTAVKSVYGRDLTGLSIATDTAANTALAELDAAMDGINAQRAIYGAGMNRLEYAIDNLSNGSQNAAASRSRIEDADYAKETTELARTQIIQQASTAMLAQANQSNQSVLSLLKG